MLAYNEIKERKYIILDGEPYEVLDSHVFRKQQRKPVNQTKLRHLINNSVRQHTFYAADVAEEADITRKKIKFLFKKENRQSGVDEFWFCSEKDPADRFFLTKEQIGPAYVYLKSNLLVDAMMFDENQVIGVSLPIKMEFKVTSAPPAVKGNSVTGASKIAVIETGATVNVPIFVEEGDTIRINTETGEYSERVI